MGGPVESHKKVGIGHLSSYIPKQPGYNNRLGRLRLLLLVDATGLRGEHGIGHPGNVDCIRYPSGISAQRSAARYNTAEVTTVKAVIFDIGGVLEVTPPTGWLQRWANELGMAVEEVEGRLSPIFDRGAVGAITLARAEHEIAAVLRLDEERLRWLMGELWAEYLGELNAGLARYFAALRPRYRTGILSNSFVGAREREQARYGFEDMCDVVVYSHEEGRLKPDPRFYLTVCERLRVRPEEAVLLDDLPACVEGARGGRHESDPLRRQRAGDRRARSDAYSSLTRPRAPSPDLPSSAP